MSVDRSPCALVALVFGGLLVGGGAPALAQSERTLGRLFFSVEERQQLDRLRELGAHSVRDSPERPLLSIDGVLTRSAGKATVWVNGSPLSADQTAHGLRITPDPTDPACVLMQAGQSAPGKFRVGTTLHRMSGVKRDLLEENSLSTTRGSGLCP